MDSTLFCPDNARAALLRVGDDVRDTNGIDFIEVLDAEAPPGTPPQRTLLVHCFRRVEGLDGSNVRIEGGVRVRNVGVEWAHPAGSVPSALLEPDETALGDLLSEIPNRDRVLVVRTSGSGDFSIYTLRLVAAGADADQPPDGFDPLLSSIRFSFKVDCPSEFDCKQEQICPEPPARSPRIDYLAKDYGSFRRLLLDRLSVVMPDWRERSAADVGIALVELLAYAADHLSYQQDAVATEAYLGTARRRASVRRHARLLDYPMHEGASARAWIAVEITPGGVAEGATLPRGTAIATGSDAAVRPDGSRLAQEPIVFETLHELHLSGSRNAIPFYTWRDPDCCLPAGATEATLAGSAAELGLSAGDVLILEEVRGVGSGRSEDADPEHRHVVRILDEPREIIDPTNNRTVLRISWHDDDALPFPLCLHHVQDAAGDNVPVAVARGNVVLADHGMRLTEMIRLEQAANGKSRGGLERRGLTHSVPYGGDRERSQAAAAAARTAPGDAVPQITLIGDSESWTPRRDLLDSGRFAPEFVVEMTEDGSATLRFGDGVLARVPAPGTSFAASYRIGSGAVGNVGAESLTRLLIPMNGIQRVWNPLPATGGMEPEPIEQVRLYAPHAFRVQQRAVHAEDYAEVARRHPEVQRAVATRRWTGSWYTWFLSIDRRGGRAVDAAFEVELRTFLNRFRLAGYDLEIDAPRFVPLDIELRACVSPGHLRGDVKRALLDIFSSRELPGSARGFFHPDQFTFGQPVHLSPLIAAAMRVPGVEWVHPLRFQRWGETEQGELDQQRIDLGRLEIARLDNDPSVPEHGQLRLQMQGGV